MLRIFFAAKVLVLILLSSCSQPTVPTIEFGHDQCIFCRMTIANPQFGAALFTDKGRVYKYDAAECMVNHLKEGSFEQAGMFCVPYDQPTQLVGVEELTFVISTEIRSPMGAYLAAFSTPEKPKETYTSKVTPLKWEEVVDQLQ